MPPKIEKNRSFTNFVIFSFFVGICCLLLSGVLTYLFRPRPSGEVGFNTCDPNAWINTSALGYDNLDHNTMEIVNNTSHTLLFSKDNYLFPQDTRLESKKVLHIHNIPSARDKIPVNGKTVERGAFVLIPKVCKNKDSCYVSGNDNMGGTEEYENTGKNQEPWPRDGYYIVRHDDNPSAPVSKIECGTDGYVCDLSAVDGFNFSVRMQFSSEGGKKQTVTLCNSDCRYGIRNFYQDKDVAGGKPVYIGCSNTSNNGNFDFSNYTPACYNKTTTDCQKYADDPNVYEVSLGPTNGEKLADKGNCVYTGNQTSDGQNKPVLPAFNTDGKCDVQCSEWENGISCCGSDEDKIISLNNRSAQANCYAPSKSWCEEVKVGQENNKYKSYCFAHDDAAGSPPFLSPHKIQIIYADGKIGLPVTKIAGKVLDNKGIDYSIMTCDSDTDCKGNSKCLNPTKDAQGSKTCQPPNCFKKCSSDSDCDVPCPRCSRSGQCVPDTVCPEKPDKFCMGPCKDTNCTSTNPYQEIKARGEKGPPGCSPEPWQKNYCVVTN